MENEKKKFGLTKAEFDNLKGGALYIATIVLAVGITFIVVATIAGIFKYTPPTPSSPDMSSEVTPELSPEATAAAN